MTTYREFTQRMVSSHNRIRAAVREENFNQNVVNRFGLILTDESVNAIATDQGWSDSWLITSKRRAKAGPPPSGDIVTMMMAGPAKATSPPPPNAAVPVAAGTAVAPPLETPPPRPVMSRTPTTSPVTAPGTCCAGSQSCWQCWSSCSHR